MLTAAIYRISVTWYQWGFSHPWPQSPSSISQWTVQFLRHDPGLAAFIYLSGWEQFVAVSDSWSSSVKLSTWVPLKLVRRLLLFSIFKPPLISSFGISYHQFADDTQFYNVIKSSSSLDFHRAILIRNNLLLNANKTEAIVTGTRPQVAKFNQSSSILVSRVVAPFIVKLRVLGVTLDNHLAFDEHNTGVVRACNYHMRALRHIRSVIYQDTANTIACCILCTRLD